MGPCVLDHDLDDDDELYDALTRLEEDPHINLFDELGTYRKRVLVQETDILKDAHENSTEHDDIVIDDIIEECILSTYNTQNHEVARQTPDYEPLRPLFGWLPTDIIKRTFVATTQYAHMPMSSVLQKHYKSPFPVCNIHRRNESVATDTVYSDTPAIDSGAASAQIFVGTTSLLTDVYGMKTDKQYSLTHWKTTCAHEELRTNLSATELRLRSARKFMTSSVLILLATGKAIHTSSIRILLSDDAKLSSA